MDFYDVCFWEKLIQQLEIEKNINSLNGKSSFALALRKRTKYFRKYIWPARENNLDRSQLLKFYKLFPELVCVNLKDRFEISKYNCCCTIDSSPIVKHVIDRMIPSHLNIIARKKIIQMATFILSNILEYLLRSQYFLTLSKNAVARPNWKSVFHAANSLLNFSDKRFSLSVYASAIEDSKHRFESINVTL